MDSDMQAKLQTFGDGFENILQEKFLATKGRSKIEGTGGVFVKANSTICTTCYPLYVAETKKAEAIVKKVAKGVDKKLRIYERAYQKGE